MYDVSRLRLLRELHHRGTLAAVARALGYDPSSISHQLRVLEREVGIPLLEPTGRRVRLTRAAVDLVAHTEVIMRELERAESTIAATKAGIGGHVRIATFQTAARTILLDALEILAARHPSLSVSFAHVIAEDAIPALVARDFDAVLSERYPPSQAPGHPSVDAATLLVDPMLLALPEGGHQRSIADLADAHWVMENTDSFARNWSETFCRSVGFDPIVRYESADVLLHLELVARGHAVAFVPALAQRPPGVRVLGTGQSRTITVSRRVGSEGNPALDAAVAALHEAARAPAAGSVRVHLATDRRQTASTPPRPPERGSHNV